METRRKLLIRALRNSKIRTICFALLLPALLGTGNCDPLKIDAAAARIQKAIDELTNQSQEWQTTLDKLEKDLVRHGQSLIANEVTQLAQRGIATTGTEIKCDADFVGNRMKEGLIDLRRSLLRQPRQPRKQFFCQAVPTSINLALAPAQRLELDFYGYNLDANRVIVSIIDNHNNSRTIDSSLIIGTPTHYLMTVNISANGAHLLPTDQQIRFILNPGLSTEEIHSVNILAPTPDPIFSVTNEKEDRPGGGGFTAGPFNRFCPAGAVAVGIQGRSGEFVNQIQLLCSPLNPDGSPGAPSSLPADGGPGGAAFSTTCPNQQILVGFSGASSGNLESIRGQCKTAADVVGQTGLVTTLPSNGGGGGSPFATACKPRFAVTGLIIFAGGDQNLVSRLDFRCSRIQLQ